MKNSIIIFLLFITTLSLYAQPSSDKLIRQGVALHDKGKYKEAITCYENALKVNSSSMSAVYEMSLSYLHLKDYKKAIEHSTKVITANFKPLLMDAYIVKGTALAKQDKIDEGISLLKEALVKCGDEYLLHFNLGLSYFNKKDNQMAVYHLQKAIEIDATHASSFLLYAYALNDLGQWVQSFYSFHFFLLLEPNTERSRDAFGEMHDIITAKLEVGSDKLGLENDIDRKKIYDQLQEKKTGATDNVSQYNYFVEASKLIFFNVGQLQNESQTGLLWFFFVPTYEEILGSGHFETYCRYVSVAYYPESLEWWEKNKTQVDDFIEWFEHGQGGSSGMEEDAYFGDDTDIESEGE